MNLTSDDFDHLQLFLSSKWKLYQPTSNNLYYIDVFDDGNEKYKNLTNLWYKIGHWQEKICLLNRDEKVFIYSISSWKVLLHEPQYMNDCMIRMKDIMSSLPDEYKNTESQEIETLIYNYLKKYCAHEIIDDYIDTDVEKGQTIKYCSKCYIEF
tara:strand:+ start:683 stop:1144 length:462 start_codon:yes stop_codon:yes gene_type:complete